MHPRETSEWMPVLGSIQNVHVNTGRSLMDSYLKRIFRFPSDCRHGHAAGLLAAGLLLLGFLVSNLIDGSRMLILYL
jgi:hypothetical protein